MKALLHRAFRKIGYDVRRYADMPIRPFSVLKLVVDSRVAAGLSVRFVQIGANDGIVADPIRSLVLQHQLPGLFVEPLPDLFARLSANYAGHPGAIFEQCAVGDHDGQATFYRIRPNSELPEWFQRIASFDKRQLSSKKFGLKGLERFVESVNVPVLTLPTLLQKHNLKDCDLLQIDTEGYDCRIVQSALKAGVRPAIINYEIVNTLPIEQAQCKRLLAEQGYAFVDVGYDTLALRED